MLSNFEQGEISGQMMTFRDSPTQRNWGKWEGEGDSQMK